MLEFAQAILNGVEIVMHEAEKYAPNHETEARKGRHSRRFEVACRVLRLELAPLFERAAVEQLAETAASSSPEGAQSEKYWTSRKSLLSRSLGDFMVFRM